MEINQFLSGHGGLETGKLFYYENVKFNPTFSTCENPEMVFKNIIEYAVDGKKGSMLFQHGVENTHYTIEDNGIVKANYKANKPDEVFEKAFITFSSEELDAAGAVPFSWNSNSLLASSFSSLVTFSNQAFLISDST